MPPAAAAFLAVLKFFVAPDAVVILSAGMVSVTARTATIDPLVNFENVTIFLLNDMWVSYIRTHAIHVLTAMKRHSILILIRT